MNKQETLAIKLTAVVAIAFLSVMVMVGLSAAAINNHLKRMEIEMHERLMKKDMLDSLYFQHLQECAFVSRKEIQLDSRGYLYSTYKRNPNHAIQHTD